MYVTSSYVLLTKAFHFEPALPRLHSIANTDVDRMKEIDFSGGTVGFWHSTGGDDLVELVSPVSVSASSNGADWHLGVLELPRDGYADTDEDLYFSGVYIESGSITTSVSGPGGKLNLCHHFLCTSLLT